MSSFFNEGLRRAKLGPARPARPRLPAPSAGPGDPGPLSPAPDRRDGPGMVVALSRIGGLTDDGVLEQPFYFQCPPTDEIGPQFSWVWNDYPTIGSGIHSNPNYAQLATVTFSSLVVDEVEIHRIGNNWIPGPRYAVARLRAGRDQQDDPIGFVNYLTEIGDALTPFALQWGQPHLWGRWDHLMPATLREFRPVEREGELDARYFTATFTEFPDAPRLRPVPAPRPPGPHKAGGKGQNGQKILARLNSAHLSDSMKSLSLIAKHYYHSPSRWRLIVKATGGLSGIGPNTDLRATVGKHKPPKTIIVPALPAGTGS